VTAPCVVLGETEQQTAWNTRFPLGMRITKGGMAMLRVSLMALALVAVGVSQSWAQ